MTAAVVRGVVRHLGPSADPPSDADLLTAFVARKDTDSFAALVGRHGPNVLGVCRRILGDSHDAEDAFQAVFLVLAQKAGCISPPGSVGGWLHGVAVRTSNKAKVSATRRRRREMIAAAQSKRKGDVPSSAEHAELCSVLDQELAKLPESLRAAIVLCDLHGKTRSEVAIELRCPEGTIAARLHRARKKLADALSRRGLAYPAVGLATVLTPAAVPARAMQSILAAILDSSISPAIQTLAREVIRGMTATKNTIALVIVTFIVGGVFTAAGTLWSAEPGNPVGDPPLFQGQKEKIAEVKTRIIDEKSKPIPQWREVGTLEGIDDLVDSIAFSPDGKSFVVGGLGGNEKNAVTLWNTDTHKVEWDGGPTASGIAAVSFSPDGKLVAATNNKATEFYEAKSGELVQPKTPFHGCKAVAFSPDGKWVAHGNSYTIGFRALDENEGAASITLDKVFEPLVGNLPAAVAWSPDSLYLAFPLPTTPNGDWLVGMMGVTPETKPKNLSGHKGKVISVAWSRDGQFLASGGEDGKVIIWDGKTFKELRRVDLGGRSGKSTIYSLAFTHDSRTLAAALEFDEGKNAQRVVLLDSSTGERTQNDLQLFWKAPPVTVAFSPNSKTMLVGCGYRDEAHRKLPPDERKKLGEVRIFTTEPEQPKAKSDGGAPAKPVAVAPKWREKAVLKDTDDLVFSVAFDPKGKTFAAGGAGKNVSVWNAADLKNVHLYNSETMTIRNIAKAIAYSPDGLHFAESYRGGAIVKFTENWKNVFMERLPQGEAVLIVKGQEIPLALAFGPTEDIQGKKLHRLAMTDGQSVIATTWLDGGQPSSAKFGPLDGAPKVEGTPPAGVAYSPDGMQLVFIPNYKMAPGDSIEKPDPKKDTLWIAQVWGGGSGTPMAFIKHGTVHVTAVAWSRDGKFIATGDAEGEIALWDGKTFKDMRRMRIGGRGGKSYIHSLTFTNDSKTLAVATTYDEGTNANRVVFFDPATGRRGDDLQQFSSPPLSLAFSPNDKTLIVGCGYRDAEARKMTAEERKKAGEVRVFTTEP